MKLLGISGSLRGDSVNSKLIREAARLLDPEHFTEADLKLPLFDADEEEASGLPEAAMTLIHQIAEADGIVISTPEYNAAVSGVLKNALDWVSRHKPNPWAGKPVAVMSAASGRAGGIRAQTMLRACLMPFSVRFLPVSELAIAGARAEFDEAGRLTSERYEAALQRMMDALQAEIARGQ